MLLVRMLSIRRNELRGFDIIARNETLREDFRARTACRVRGVGGLRGALLRDDYSDFTLECGAARNPRPTAWRRNALSRRA